MPDTPKTQNTTCVCSGERHSVDCYLFMQKPIAPPVVETSQAENEKETEPHAPLRREQPLSGRASDSTVEAKQDGHLGTNQGSEAGGLRESPALLDAFADYDARVPHMCRTDLDCFAAGAEWSRASAKAEQAPGQPSDERIFHELRANRRRTWNRPADDEFEHWLGVLARRLGVKP